MKNRATTSSSVSDYSVANLSSGRPLRSCIQFGDRSVTIHLFKLWEIILEGN